MNYSFDWNELAFVSKKPLKELHALFVVAPRELSEKRFKQLVMEYLPKGNMVIGLSKEQYVLGYEDQPQFRMLQVKDIQKIIDDVNTRSKKHKLYLLEYFQRDLQHIVEKVAFGRVVLINGSWKYAFHNLAPYYTIANQHIPITMLSPFVDEAEALDYEKNTTKLIAANRPFAPGLYPESQMLTLANEAAKYSFDYTFQTGVCLGRRVDNRYDFLAWSFNKVVPFQTHAMHYGNSREKNFSPPNDLNHYDAVHAEVEMIIKAGKERINLHGTTLFINLLPCPSCARMLAETDITEFVYTEDHSNGYAIKMLEAAGKTVRRVV